MNKTMNKIMFTACSIAFILPCPLLKAQYPMYRRKYRKKPKNDG